MPSLPRIGSLLMLSLVTAVHVLRSPCLPTSNQKYIQSKCEMWFIRNKHLPLNFLPSPNVFMRTPNRLSEEEHHKVGMRKNCGCVLAGANQAGKGASYSEEVGCV